MKSIPGGEKDRARARWEGPSTGENGRGVIHTLGAQSMLVPLGICMWAAWVWEATLILTAWCSEPP